MVNFNSSALALLKSVCYLVVLIELTCSRIIPRSSSPIFARDDATTADEIEGIESILGDWYGPQRNFGDHPLHVTLSPDEIYKPSLRFDYADIQPESRIISLPQQFSTGEDNLETKDQNPLEDADTHTGYFDYFKPGDEHSLQANNSKELSGPYESGEEAGLEANNSKEPSGLEDLLKNRKFYIFYLNDSQKVVQEVDGQNFTVYLDFDEMEDERGVSANEANSTKRTTVDSYGPYVHPFPTSGYEVSPSERIIIMNEDKNNKQSEYFTTQAPKIVTNSTVKLTTISNLELFEILPHHKPMHERCFKPFVNDETCGDIRFMWYYDLRANQCFEFLYAGCRSNDNANIFDSQSQCSNLCSIKAEESVW